MQSTTPYQLRHQTSKPSIDPLVTIGSPLALLSPSSLNSSSSSSSSSSSDDKGTRKHVPYKCPFTHTKYSTPPSCEPSLLAALLGTSRASVMLHTRAAQYGHLTLSSCSSCLRFSKPLVLDFENPRNTPLKTPK